MKVLAATRFKVVDKEQLSKELSLEVKFRRAVRTQFRKGVEA